jgi:hypothetical protein
LGRLAALTHLPGWWVCAAARLNPPYIDLDIQLESENFMGLPRYINPENHYELLDDFFNLDTVRWQSIDDGGTGTNTANDVEGGQVSIVTAGADNDYHVMATAKKVFKFQPGRPLWFEAEFVLTEANTSAANWLMGVCSITTTGILANDGAGPATTYDGALIYKVDGTMTTKLQTSASTTQQSVSLATFTSGTTYRAGFEFDPQDGTTGRVTPWLYSVSSGGLLTDLLTRKNALDNSLTIGLSGLGGMYGVFGVKAGSASAETLKMNRIRIIGTR